jgi:hypothetical protein
MALNMTRKYSSDKTQVWLVPDGTLSGAAVIDINSQPGVALVSEGGATSSTTIGPYTISGIPSGGVGLPDNYATVAIDGAFRFPVVGASNTTPVNTLVYAVISGSTVTGLTLTAGSNVPFGKVDRFIGRADASDPTSATETSVWLGDFSSDAT